MRRYVNRGLQDNYIMRHLRGAIFFFFLFYIVTCRNNEAPTHAVQGSPEIDEKIIKIDSDSIVDLNTSHKNEPIKLNLIESDSLNTLCEKCNVRLIEKINSNIQNLTENDIHLFLCSLSKACTANVEFSEFSNEVLFKVIEVNTEDFINALGGNNDIEREFIYNELSYPILDYDLEQIMRNVNEINQHDDVKFKVLEALKNASSN